MKNLLALAAAFVALSSFAHAADTMDKAVLSKATNTVMDAMTDGHITGNKLNVLACVVIGPEALSANGGPLRCSVEGFKSAFTGTVSVSYQIESSAISPIPTWCSDLTGNLIPQSLTTKMSQTCNVQGKPVTITVKLTPDYE